MWGRGLAQGKGSGAVELRACAVAWSVLAPRLVGVVAAPLHVGERRSAAGLLHAKRLTSGRPALQSSW